MLHICCIINDTRLRGGTIDVGMGHQPEKKMGHTKVDEEAKKKWGWATKTTLFLLP